MRKLLMVASAAAIAMTMPALAKEKGPGGEKGRGGDKAAHAQKPDKHQGRGKPEKAHKAEKMHKADRDFARQDSKPDKQFRKQEAKADKDWGKREAKAEKQWRKSEAKEDKKFAKQEKRLREDDRRFREDDRRFRDEDLRFSDRDGRFDDDGRRFDDGDRRFASSADCPPGLAKKSPACIPPGQAKKMFTVGERLPEDLFEGYNLPARYQDWYQDGGQYSYRYDDDGYIYQVDRSSNIISRLIPLLGGGFGVGNLLPAGYDVYNLPTQYRDDFYDTDDAFYRYGDNAIYQVDPKTQVIQAVVALLAGNLNVGQLLPTGYDTYNLPMQYRDQYVDSDEAMYRYADGNIYEIDPQTRIVEQIVAMLT